jgi:hypothetical protein
MYACRYRLQREKNIVVSLLIGRCRAILSPILLKRLGCYPGALKILHPERRLSQSWKAASHLVHSYTQFQRLLPKAYFVCKSLDGEYNYGRTYSIYSSTRIIKITHVETCYPRRRIKACPSESGLQSYMAGILHRAPLGQRKRNDL